jgi:putative oxidoreductase
MENKLVSLVGRVLLAHMFLIAGIQKIAQYSGTQGYMEAHGLSGMLLPLVILLEIGGGLALVLGLFTRWVAYALALFSVVAALFFHSDFSQQLQMIMFMKNLTIAGGMCFLALHGPGAWSLQGRARA